MDQNNFEPHEHGGRLTNASQAKNAFNDSETILELVLNTIPQGVFWKNRDSVYTGCNQVVCRTLGLNGPQDLIGKSDDQFPTLTREQAASYIRADREVIESGRPQPPIVEPLNRYDGETIWVETIKVPLRDAEGNVIGVLGTWRDVTERRQAEEALRRSEQRYRSLATATSEMVWTSNAKGDNLTVEPPLEQFTGLSHVDLVGAGWLRAVHPDDRARAEDAWAFAVANSEPYECEFRLRRFDGEWRDIHSRGIPILTQSGQIQEWIGVGVDVTIRKRSEDHILHLNDELEQRVRERTAELQAANKELEAFSYSVSHDLRAPLRAIDGFSRILLADFSDQLPADAQEYLQDIRNSSRVMGQLVDDLLRFSRLGRQPIRKQRLRPAELVKRCIDELEHAWQSRNVDFRLAPLPECWADPALVKQVWMNLISNALKYSSKREMAVIEIGCRLEDSGDRLFFVKDNGVGFDMRYIHKLFGVFQRLHRVEDYEGTGVGLATVQRIVQRHGGRIWAEAELNVGATFYFTLPESGSAT